MTGVQTCALPILFGFRLAYTFSDPKRGDIVIFNAPDSRLLDARDKPALHGAVAAVDDKDLRAAEALDRLADAGLRTLAEIDLSRAVKFKCLHGMGPPCLRAEWSARGFSAPMVAHLRAHCKRSKGREKAHFLRDFVLT